MHIGMIHCIRVCNKKNETIADVITKIVGIYNGRGFKVVIMHGDNAFEGLTDRFMNTHQIQPIVCGADGHVPLVKMLSSSSRNEPGVYIIICHMKF